MRNALPLKKNALACCLGFLLSLPCFAQTKTIVLLSRQAANSHEPAQKLSLLLQLCDQRQSLSADSLRKYAFAAKALSLSLNDRSGQARADYSIANYYVKKGALDSALQTCDRQLQGFLVPGSGDTEVFLRLLALKAQVLVKSNKYKEGMAAYFTTLAEAERSNDTLMQMIAKNGVGWVNMEMEQNTEALKWFFRALQTSGNPALHQQNGNIYSNIAAIYTALGKFDSAEGFVRKAIGYSKQDENLFYLSNSLNVLADNFIAQNKPALAEEPLTEAIQIRERIGDPFYIVSDLSQLALFYAKQKEPAKGIAASLRGIGLARKFGLQSKLPYLQFALAKNYKAAGDYLGYGETMESVLALKDSVYLQNSEEELVLLKARYNQQKQETMIVQQKLDLNKKNTVIYAGVITGFFAIVIAVILFRTYRRKQVLMVERLKEEEARNLQKAIETAQEAERKRISADLHDNLGAYASAISANADDLMHPGTNAKTVVQHIKRNADDILNNLNETIWVLNKTEIYLTSVCDRFKTYVGRIQSAYPGVTLNIFETITENCLLSPEAALNMLRIMQEAFHNAIKHSKGDCISVDINGGKKIEISIADNGKGMLEQVTVSGNGLKNMERRAKANGWKLTMGNGAVSGTVVRISI